MTRFIIVLLLTFTACTFKDEINENGNYPFDYRPINPTIPVFVTEVIDGDTFHARFANGSIKSIRLIGINTPELDECDGTVAKDSLIRILTNKNLLLEYDKDTLDSFGRTLAYAFLVPDTLFINGWMIYKGLAHQVYYRPNDLHRGKLIRLQQLALQKGIGIWKNCTKLTETARDDECCIKCEAYFNYKDECVPGHYYMKSLMCPCSKINVPLVECTDSTELRD